VTHLFSARLPVEVLSKPTYRNLAAAEFAFSDVGPQTECGSGAGRYSLKAQNGLSVALTAHFGLIPRSTPQVVGGVLSLQHMDGVNRVPGSRPIAACLASLASN
jgi:hypothetical protein